MNAMLEVSVFGLETVLRLEKDDAWSMAKCPPPPPCVREKSLDMCPNGAAVVVTAVVCASCAVNTSHIRSPLRKLEHPLQHGKSSPTVFR